MSSLLRSTPSDMSRPSHDELASFLATFLPPSPRPRDVDYFYHVPRRFIPARPPPASLTRTEPITIPTATGYPSRPPILDVNGELQGLATAAPKNTTPVSHVTFSITPTPGVYTSLTASAPSVPYQAKPAAFIHRPWSLDRRAVPPGTTVLSSHTGFDEVLTTGWNVQLASRLGLQLGRVELENGAKLVSVEDQKLTGGKCVCIQGYKGDPERRIGFVGGFGQSTGGSLHSRSTREERGDEDVDGGVNLSAANGHIPVVSPHASPQGTKTMSVQNLLAKVETEFDGVGEVFDFSSPLYVPNAKEEQVGTSAIEYIANTSIATPSTATIPLNTLPNATDPPLAPLTSSSIPEQPPIATDVAVTTPRRQPKRQKKNPPEPQPQVPQSIPLKSAPVNPLIPSSTISAVAILNAFHPEEVERVIAAAYAGGWIRWQGVGIPEAGQITSGDGHEKNTLAPLDESQVEAQAQPGSAAQTQPTLLSQTTSQPQAQPPPPHAPRSSSRLLCLTGAPRAPGLLHVQRHYLSLITVVCVGHDACEEWGIRFLAGECSKKWPMLDVRTIFEPEVVVPRERKKPQAAPMQGEEAPK